MLRSPLPLVRSLYCRQQPTLPLWGVWAQPRPCLLRHSAFRPSTTASSPSKRRRISVGGRVAAVSVVAVAGSSAAYILSTEDPSSLTAITPTTTTTTPTSSTNFSRMFTDQDLSLAFRHRSTGDLIQSWLVYQLIRIPSIADYTLPVLQTLSRWNIAQPVYWLIKHSLFQQFCGGESLEQLEPAMKQLHQAGIHTMLDLSVEADLPTETADPTDQRSPVDIRADSVAAAITQCIHAASLIPGNFAAVKVTGMGSTKALKNISGVLAYTRDLFACYARPNQDCVDFEGFAKVVSHLPGAARQKLSREELQRLFDTLPHDLEGNVRWYDFSAGISFQQPATAYLFTGKVQPPAGDHAWNAKSWSVSEKYLPETTDADWEEFRKVVTRIDGVCATAKQLHVRLLFDAEQSYFQPAIDTVVLLMMQKYNRDTAGGPLVYNTYQLYLKDAYARLQVDVERARTHNDGPFQFAAKVVRGAYMTSERKRAETLGLRDPIQENVENTHRDYNRAITTLLQEASRIQEKSQQDDPAHQRFGKLSFCVASHNKDSVIHACAEMHRYGIARDDQTVMFGQLYGMHDHVTYTLARLGYSVSKYVPYGPVEDVIPYLLRRAQENRAIFASSSRPGDIPLDDRSLLGREIKRRLFGGIFTK